jgi:UDP-2-acetamido-2,6-beta-L-arabino-hexul-4-ose reductase
MRTVLITGAHGFVGRNLGTKLKELKSSLIIEVDIDSPPELLERGLQEADIIFHLAGINRPLKTEEYAVGNTDFTREICDRLKSLGRKPAIIFSSSIQAELDNPYGVSKRLAEEELLKFARQKKSKVAIFRMKNIFGKWCRPNYNSVVATFCYNIARGFPISISDPDRVISLVHIDDVCASMIQASGLSAENPGGGVYQEVGPVFEISLGKLAERIKSFRDSRNNLYLPELDDLFTRKLYGTYLSYLEGNDFSYGLDIKSDPRGSLAEFLKGEDFGQIFVSRTKPGITRGNHYHHTKAEKFLVVQGEANIRFRHIQGGEIIEYVVSGDDFRVVDIPPGYTHSIENIGIGELVTIFWADEVFDPNQPDTLFEEVVKTPGENA